MKPKSYYSSQSLWILLAKINECFQVETSTYLSLCRAKTEDLSWSKHSKSTFEWVGSTEATATSATRATATRTSTSLMTSRCHAGEAKFNLFSILHFAPWSKWEQTWECVWVNLSLGECAGVYYSVYECVSLLLCGWVSIFGVCEWVNWICLCRCASLDVYVFVIFVSVS